MADFGRNAIQITSFEKANVIYDFAYGEYLANVTFFDKISKIQTGLLQTGKVVLDNGLTADADSPGGLIALQMHMDAVEASRSSMIGLAKLGLTVEKNLWKNI